MLSVTEAACHSIYETLEQRAAPSAAAPTLNVPIVPVSFQRVPLQSFHIRCSSIIYSRPSVNFVRRFHIFVLPLIPPTGLRYRVKQDTLDGAVTV